MKKTKLTLNRYNNDGDLSTAVFLKHNFVIALCVQFGGSSFNQDLTI